MGADTTPGRTIKLERHLLWRIAVIAGLSGTLVAQVSKSDAQNAPRRLLTVRRPQQSRQATPLRRGLRSPRSGLIRTCNGLGGLINGLGSVDICARPTTVTV
jgi:hypothetical protein